MIRKILFMFVIASILAIIGLFIGANIGGNFFPNFEFMGGRGYEATGYLGALIGALIGLLLAFTSSNKYYSRK